MELFGVTRLTIGGWRPSPLRECAEAVLVKHRLPER